MRVAIFLLLVFLALTCSGQDDQRIIQIPVIFHVFYRDAKPDNGINEVAKDGGNSTQNIPLEKLLAELKNLHEDFQLLNSDTLEIHSAFKTLIGNPRIDFFIADTILQQGSSEKGVKRICARTSKRRAVIKSKILDPQKYLNVYIGNFGSSVPSETPWVYPENDAVFLEFKWVGQGYRVLTHETGHWLGLLHVHGGSGGAAGDDCREAGDNIEDTPMQRNATDTSCLKCPPEIKEQNCSSELTNYNNFMDYSGCRKMFTQGQVRRMREVVRVYRKTIWSRE